MLSEGFRSWCEGRSTVQFTFPCIPQLLIYNLVVDGKIDWMLRRYLFLLLHQSINNRFNVISRNRYLVMAVLYDLSRFLVTTIIATVVVS